MQDSNYDVQRNMFRNLIVKRLGEFTMRTILGQAKSPKFAHRKALSLLTKYVKIVICIISAYFMAFVSTYEPTTMHYFVY